MTNAELIQTIRNEIDKRYAEYRAKMKTHDFTYYEGMADALDLFEQFIDSLESEKPMEQDGLLEEVKRYYSDNFEYLSSDQPTLSILTNVARHFAQWSAERQKEQDDKELSDLLTITHLQGAEQMKEQMLKEAVEGTIVDAGFDDHTALVSIPDKRYDEGDKVRIVVIPNTDEK